MNAPLTVIAVLDLDAAQLPQCESMLGREQCTHRAKIALLDIETHQYGLTCLSHQHLDRWDRKRIQRMITARKGWR